MNVLICDDDTAFIGVLKQKLSAYDCDVRSYTTVSAVENDGLVFDIAFIDIELGENMSGFELVRHLRNMNDKCVIAFFTNYVQYAIKGYEYQPYRYILKTEPDKLIDRRIGEVFAEYHRRGKTVSGSYNGYTFCVRADDIYYIGIEDHVAALHTKKGDFEVYKQMKELSDELCDSGFLRCHRSYMVNLSHVIILRSDHFFVLDDPERTAVPVGIRYRNICEKHYTDHFKRII